MESEDTTAYIRRVGELVRRAVFPVHRSPGTESVPIGQQRIMLELLDHPEGIPSGKLAELVGVGTGRIGNALKRLEGEGLVSRSRDERDSRSTIVMLTDKGRDYSSSIQKVFMELLTFIFERVGKERIDALIETSEEIFAAEDLFFSGREEAQC